MRTFVFILSVVILSFAPLSECLAQSPAVAQEIDRVATGIDKQIHRGNFRAEAHERYHSKRADWYSQLDMAGTIFLTAAAVFGLCLPLAYRECLKNNPKADNVVQIIAIVGLFVSVVFMYLGYGSKFREHAVLAQRWSSLRNDWEDLRAEASGMEEQEVLRRALLLAQQESRIESAEPPSPNNKVLAESYDETAKAMNLKPASYVTH
jgi:hypothetical protein